VRICHISARLPPDAGASAIQPVQIAAWCRDAGDHVRFVTYARPASRRHPAPALPGLTAWVPPPKDASGAFHMFRVSDLACAARALRRAWPHLEWADVVHVHGASIIADASTLFAAQLGKPVVLTIYGPEVWTHHPSRWWAGAFARAYHSATHVTFTSHGLLARAIERGLARRDVTVVYPPVGSRFGPLDEHWRGAARTALGVRARHLLLCVRSLDDTGGHSHLLEGLSEVVRTHPDTRLVLIGIGPSAPELRAAARAWGVEGHVTFAGLVDHDIVAQYDVAADVFVTPSAAGGVTAAALEALACGCPVITADSDGGHELQELFGFDVSVVPRENATALARAIVQAVEEKRRVSRATSELIDREHRCDAVCGQYRTIYERVLTRGAAQRSAPPTSVHDNQE
jgi:glycosyltransferase involved in cell wall biosynthesis